MTFQKPKKRHRYRMVLLLLVFFICNHDKEHLEIILQELVNFNPDLGFTYKSNEKEIPFLDLNFKLNEGIIFSTDVYFKSTDRHQCLPSTSSHPNHTKTSIVFSQELRVKSLF